MSSVCDLQERQFADPEFLDVKVRAGSFLDEFCHSIWQRGQFD